MEKLTVLVFCCLLLAGCGTRSAETIPMDATSVSVADSVLATASPTVEETFPRTITLYTPNENTDGVEGSTVTLDAVTESAIVQQLVLAGVLPEGVCVKEFAICADSQDPEQSQLVIDFNQTFGDHLSSMGTAGESVTLASVVNTFLGAYQAYSLLLRVEGAPLETGHAIYDFPLEFTP